MQRRNLLAALPVAILLAACATTPAPTTITETAARNPQLATLSRLIADAGLADTLSGSGPYTVFAPSDEAFKAVPASTLAELARDKARLKAVLSYHVLHGKLSAAEVKIGPRKSLEGSNLALATAGTMVTVEDAVVQQADLAATNGVLHIVDRVLLPPKR